MLYQIASLVLEVAASLVAATCLLRLYMQYQRIPLSVRAGTPLAGFVFALTDWLVLPLRRVVPAFGRLDTASLVGAYLIQLAQYLLLALMGGMGAIGVPALVVLAAFGLVRMTLTCITGLVIVYALLSWVQARTLATDFLERLVLPLLNPIRRVVPLVGGLDLSPLVLLVLIQIAGIVLGSVQGAVLVLF